MGLGTNAIKKKRYIVEEVNQIVGCVLALRRELPFGQSWIYAPRGPVVRVDNEPAWKLLIQMLKEIARREKSFFIRIDPLWVDGDKKASTLLSAKSWCKAETEVQPRHTLLIDLKQSEEELLKNMHHKTRYNIGVAKKHGIQIRFSTNKADLQLFWQLAQEVSGRSAFNYHPLSHYEALLEEFSSRGIGELAIAEYQGRPVAVHIIIRYGDRVTYVHGASSSKDRAVMAPVLLQWETMRRAKANGATSYDMFGIAPPNAAPNHSWQGITRFKLGFGGQRTQYIGAYDSIRDTVRYQMYIIARRLRR